jgi:hypothetical protein
MRLGRGRDDYIEGISQGRSHGTYQLPVALPLFIAGFDVVFDVYVPPHQLTTHHINRGFKFYGTVPDDMKHDETVLRTGDYETAALPLSYAGML